MKSRNRTTPWAALAGVALGCSIGAAAAAPLALPQTISPGFNGMVWHLNNDQGAAGACGTAAPGLGFRDAGNTGTAPDLGNAYDGGWLVYVNGTRVSDADGTIDITGNVATSDPVSISGLNVSMQYLFSTTRSAARILVVLNNPTAAPITATVNVPTNIEEDNPLNVNGTSSGDTTVSTADRWLVISESANVNVAPTNEVTSFVFYGPGTPAETPTLYNSTVWTCSGTAGIEAVFDVSIPANSTRYLMFFAGLGGVATADNVPASAISAMSAFNSNTTVGSDLLAGLTSTQLFQVLNWNFPAPPPTTSCQGLSGTRLTYCRYACNTSYSPGVRQAYADFYERKYGVPPECAAP